MVTKVRKHCVECGVGISNAPKNRCRECYYDSKHRDKADIRKALRAWAALHGDTAPSARIWGRKNGTNEEDWPPRGVPSFGGIVAVYGSWRLALQDAGLDMRQPGPPAHGDSKRHHRYNKLRSQNRQMVTGG